MTPKESYTQLQSLCIAKQTLANSPTERQHWIDVSKGLYLLRLRSLRAPPMRAIDDDLIDRTEAESVAHVLRTYHG